jgi:hypothetical protein
MRVGELAVRTPRPQTGYIFPPGKDCQGYVNLEGAEEFAANTGPARPGRRARQGHRSRAGTRSPDETKRRADDQGPHRRVA